MAFGESLVSWAHSLCLDLWGSSWEYHGDKTPIFQRSLYRHWNIHIWIHIDTIIYTIYILYTMYGNIVCNIYIYIYIRGIYYRSIIEPLSTSTGYIIGTDTPGTENHGQHLFQEAKGSSRTSEFTEIITAVNLLNLYVHIFNVGPYQYYSSSVVVTIFCCS